MKNILIALTLAAALLPAGAQTNSAAAVPETGFAGKVLEATNAAGYTYVLVDTGAKKAWAATTQFAVKPGDTVKVAPGMDMPKYHSRTLNRDFDSVYFTGSITVESDAAAPSAVVLPAGHPPVEGVSATTLPAGHPPIGGDAAAKRPKALKPADVDLTGIKPAKDGKTVQQIIEGKAKLDGKNVTVRAKVVKYNGEIMGKNWLHLRDGSGSAEKGDHDLTVTTATEAKVGDTVLVTGKVSLNKDFGAGYKYAIILEDAQVTVE
jgi:hypothetical protein